MIRHLNVFYVFLFTLGFLLGVQSVRAQEEDQWWNELSTEEEVDWQSIDDLMSDFQLAPLPVHQLTKEQLEVFPFLSDRMIERLLYYIYKYKPLQSLDELRGVEGMDYRTLSYLKRYLYLDKWQREDSFTVGSLFRNLRHQLISRVDVPLFEREGYHVSSLKQRYLGENFYHSLRYQVNGSARFRAGVNVEKDEGEPLFNRYSRGYDFVSAYVQLAQIGRLQQLIVGDYKADFGFGLVMNNGFYLGKNVSASFHRLNHRFSPSSSLQENGFLRGVAARFQLSPKWEATVYTSLKKGDARTDSLFIKSLITTGYHRLINEWETRNKYVNYLIGSSLYYNNKQVEWGLTAVYNYFNKSFNPPLTGYRKYDWRGNRFINVSGMYKWFAHRLILSGEVAVDGQAHLAWQNRLSYRLSVHNLLYVINRYYETRFQSVYGNAFRENTRVNNELGTFIALENNAIKDIKWLLTTDVFYFPYLRYRVSRPHTLGIDINTLFHYSPHNQPLLLIKLGYKIKPLDYRLPASKEVVVAPQGRLHSLLEWRCRLGQTWTMKTRFQWVFAHHYNFEKAQGGLASVGIDGRPTSHLRVQASCAAFSVDDYEARVYGFEPGMLYQFTSFAANDKGMRGALVGQWEASDRFSLQCRWSAVGYFNRSSIGTGSQQIRSPFQSEIQLQVRYRWGKGKTKKE